MATLRNQIFGALFIISFVTSSLGQDPVLKEIKAVILKTGDQEQKGQEDKRRFDPISRHSSFSAFGKRDDANHQIFEYGGQNSKESKPGLNSDSNLETINEGTRINEDVMIDKDNSQALLSNGTLHSQVFSKHTLTNPGSSSSSILGDNFSSDYDNHRVVPSVSNHSPFSSSGNQLLQGTSTADMFDSYGKRKFDSISSLSSFRRLGKRNFDSNFENMDYTSSGNRHLGTISEDGRFVMLGERFHPVENGGRFFQYGKEDDSLSVPNVAWLRYLLSQERQLYNLPDNPQNISFDKRRLDKISNSAFSAFGKKDQIDHNFLNNKRKFDSISGISSFGGFGKRQDEEKRRFDSISGISSFGGFGKREGGEKRKFDSISGISSFGRFGKRQEEEKRKFDSISGISSFGGFGKREGGEKRRFDSISGISSFGGFGKREGGEKRRFDSISGISSFGGFGKREGGEKRRFDSISGISSFGGFGKREDGEKRRFDSISGISSFGGFGKREGGEKRRFDSISGISSFGGFGKREDGEKRRFDSISGISSFGGFGKREDGEKRRFDSISGISSFGGFGKREDGEKRKFDSISGISSFGGFGKRQDDEKRRFDSISGVSSFGGFGKRQDGEKRKFDSISGISSFGGFGKRQEEEKRRFDSISGVSSFGGFGKREDEENLINDDVSGEDKRRFDSIAGARSFGGFAKKRSLALQVSSAETNKEDTLSRKRRVAMDTTNSLGNINSQKESTVARKPLITKRNVEEQFTQDLLNKDDVISKGSIVKRSLPDVDSLDGYIDLHKRRFDRISGLSNFRSFGKRANDGDNVALQVEDFPGYSKRRFDRIGSGSTFGVFGKRGMSSDREYDAMSPGIQNSANFDKRRFDRISSGIQGFRSFGKRRLDRISGASAFSSFGKRRFDRITGSSQFTGFGRKRSDNNGSSGGFNNFDVMKLENIPENIDIIDIRMPKLFTAEGTQILKRRFDPIGYRSNFRIFGKRNSLPDNHDIPVHTANFLPWDLGYESSDQKTNLNSFLGQDSLEPIDIDSIERQLIADHLLRGLEYSSLDLPHESSISKRHFDPIDRHSMFRRFGRLSNSPLLHLSQPSFEDDSDKEVSYGSINSSPYIPDNENEELDRLFKDDNNSREIAIKLLPLLQRTVGVYPDTFYQK